MKKLEEGIYELDGGQIIQFEGTGRPGANVRDVLAVLIDRLTWHESAACTPQTILARGRCAGALEALEDPEGT